MKYGLVGEKLGHSFSLEIHRELGNDEYILKEVSCEDIDSFFLNGEFNGINVTIPYKETVIPYLHYIDNSARDIGAVNTVVNRGGKLYGYNTDFYGMVELIRHTGIELRGKKVIVLGTGGTSKTAEAVSHSLGAGCVMKVSRSGRGGAVTYDELYRDHSDANIIINTTPSGMYPKTDDIPVRLEAFPNLLGVIDAVYNPLRTRLITEAQKRGIPACGGLYMLVAQAVGASEIFLGTRYDTSVTERIYKRLLRSKENIVLIGMPASGKTSVGRELGEALQRQFIDTDDIIVKMAGMTIPEIFAKRGEGAFRDIESDAVREAAKANGAVIATGGGAILREENLDALHSNGRLYFIDRPPELLIPTSDRPLSSDRDAILKRYTERYPIYCSVCDEIIDGSKSVAEVTRLITESFTR